MAGLRQQMLHGTLPAWLPKHEPQFLDRDGSNNCVTQLVPCVDRDRASGNVLPVQAARLWLADSMAKQSALRFCTIVVYSRSASVRTGAAAL